MKLSEMLKKAGACALALALALSMSACSQNAEKSKTSEESSAAETVESSEDNSEAEADSAETADTNAETPSYSDGLDENGFFVGVKATDYITLPEDIMSIKIDSEAAAVTEDAINYEIDNYLQEYSTDSQVTDRAVEDGDTVNIDYVGSVDGVEFTGGNTNGAGTDVTIGVTQYIDDFLEQLIGHEPGETINVEVTFPEGYPTSTDTQGNEMVLANQDAVFVTTINYISVPVTPELTDEFVNEHFSEEKGWKTVDEMKAGITEDLEKEYVNGYIKNYLSETAENCEAAQPIYDFQVNTMISYYSNYAENYGMEFEDFIKQYLGVETKEELIEQNKETNESSAKYFGLIQAIAETENLTVSDEDITAYFLEEMGTEDYFPIVEFYGMPYVKQIVLENVVVKHLTASAEKQ